MGYNDEDIIASYAIGSADGGDGNEDNVGGLVGHNWRYIIASYATGNAYGGDGNEDNVGGLVGSNFNNRSYSPTTVTASYATGNADGGDGNGDNVGGLVGFNINDITASYATGNASGGAGNFDRAGGLVGYNHTLVRPSIYYTYTDTGTITESYSFGGTRAGENPGNDGTERPSGVNAASDFTASNAGSTWNNASNNTLGAWDFGTASQNPAPVYNDYDGRHSRAYYDDRGGPPRFMQLE